MADQHNPELWSTAAFSEHFLRIDRQMPERAFAFVLGAGASASSGIATGGQLVDQWINEIKLRDPKSIGLTVETWATSETLEVDNFDYPRRAEFYPQIYHRRFGDDLEEGYAYLEEAMKDAEPSLGYSMLAQILAETRHKVAITTNFDNLVADSVLLYTNTFAQICGHESLTSYIRVQPRRPLVAKIHRDLLLGPQNDLYETALLHEDWARELRRLFTHFTPLFVGYGGNDGSLMNFLESLRPGAIPGGVFWAYRDSGDIPNKRICNLVARHSGKLVAIIDFDVFMTQMAGALGFGLLDGKILEIAQSRASRLQGEWNTAKQSVANDGAADGEVSESVRLAKEEMAKIENRRVEQGDDWYSWELRAGAERDPVQKEAIYKSGSERLPNSLELAGSFAGFLQNQKRYDEAESLYRRAIQLNPNNPIYPTFLCNLAMLLIDMGKNPQEAERLFRSSLEAAPNSVGTLNGLATFMWEVRGDEDESEKLYRRATELRPNNPIIINNLVALLISRGQLGPANENSDKNWQLVKEKANQLAATVALFRGLLLRFDNRDDRGALGRLKTILETDFVRDKLEFNYVLAAAERTLGDGDDLSLYRAMAAAILDSEKVAALDEIQRWTDAPSISLEEPWDSFTNPLLPDT